ncbi:MAG: hypothetical protein NTW05_10535 [Pseudonocardiales bacterium]|jgi:hypothetical protein|nr:hypothetical protein [Pseudonocardiales bacterium]
MRAAQNQVLLTMADAVAALQSLPARTLDLFAELPPAVRAGVVIALVVTFCTPRLLRALDDYLFNRRARRKITSSADWVEVVRIRNEPRRLWGRRPAPTDQGQPPGPAPDAAGAAAAAGDQDGAEPP